jgi:hypothetical protein
VRLAAACRRSVYSLAENRAIPRIAERTVAKAAARLYARA